MALDDVFNVTYPNQQNGAGSTRALIIEEFTGMVEGTLDRKSLLKGWVKVRPVVGTDTIRQDAVGESTIQVLVPGATPDGTTNDFAKNTLTVDTVVLARATFPILDVFQSSWDRRSEVATEHGKKLAKLWDNGMFIQAIKASLRTESSFSNGSAGKPAGHFGGSIETLALAGDATDPAKLYAAIARLMVKLEDKDVDPQGDDLVIACKPATFYTLLQAEQLINAEYITANGNKVQGMVLKTYGVPVVRSVNYPAGANVAAHPLSTANNSNGYNGDFTKAVLTAFAPRALLAGETIPLTGEVFYDNKSKLHFVDAHMAYGATTGRAEFAASIYIP
jgi:hypothetical protein